MRLGAEDDVGSVSSYSEQWLIVGRSVSDWPGPKTAADSMVDDNRRRSVIAIGSTAGPASNQIRCWVARAPTNAESIVH